LETGETGWLVFFFFFFFFQRQRVSSSLRLFVLIQNGTAANTVFLPVCLPAESLFILFILFMRNKLTLELASARPSPPRPPILVFEKNPQKEGFVFLLAVHHHISNNMILSFLYDVSSGQQQLIILAPAAALLLSSGATAAAAALALVPVSEH
jgi:hypothetical protein